MSSLSDVEQRYLARLLGMESGYVLDYTDHTFSQLFNRYGVDIHSTSYQTYGTSKAKKMRAFWESQPDPLVGKLVSEMLDVYEANCKLNNKQVDVVVLQESRGIVARLLGKSEPNRPPNQSEEFLSHEFSVPNIRSLPIEASVVPIIEYRLEEARIALGAGAHLSVVFLCGSVLEAVLLGAAQRAPQSFNQAVSAPQGKDGNVKQFADWSLAQLIDVASEIGLLKPDVKKFSHGLRNFRNYIHPYQQLVSRFMPDEHTAKLCFQALKAALASVAGERK